MRRAALGGMTPKHFTELCCWQLADELRREVIAICANDRVRKRRRFCDSFEDAAGSVCRNISEGFSRFESGQIVQFFGYALASLAEVQDHLRECRSREFIDQARFDQLWDLAEHTKATILNFKRPHEKAECKKRGRKRRGDASRAQPSAPKRDPGGDKTPVARRT